MAVQEVQEEVNIQIVAYIRNASVGEGHDPPENAAMIAL
jgi:hypothetical protein